MTTRRPSRVRQAHSLAFSIGILSLASLWPCAPAFGQDSPGADASQGQASTAAADAHPATAPGARAEDAEKSRGADKDALDAYRREVAMLAEQSLTPEALRKMRKEKPGFLESLPLHRVELEFLPGENLVHGRERVSVIPAKGADKVYLRMAAVVDGARNLAVSSGKMEGEDVPVRMAANGLFFVVLNDAARRKAEAGAPVDISLSYSLKLKRKNVGDNWGRRGKGKGSGKCACGNGQECRSGDVGDGGCVDISGTSADPGLLLAGIFPEVSTTLSPDGAGTPGDLPRKGEPLWGGAANYAVTILAPADVKFAGTGTEVGRFRNWDGRMRTTRVAVAVRGFALASGTGWKETAVPGPKSGATRIRIISPTDIPTDNAAVAVRRLMDHNSSRLAPYPWATFELAWTPLFRNQDAAAYPNALFLNQEEVDRDSMTAAKAMVPDITSYLAGIETFLIAREASHQWFRGLVGSDGRADPFADEGIAVQSACRFMEKQQASKGKGKKGSGRKSPPCMEERGVGGYRGFRFAGGEDAPLRQPLDDQDDKAFPSISGAKGAVLLEKVWETVGATAYDSNLKRYVAGHWFGESTSDRMVEELSRGVPKEKSAALKSLVLRFMDETTGDEDMGGAFSPNDAEVLASVPPEMQELVRSLLEAFAPEEMNGGKGGKPVGKGGGASPKGQGAEQGP